MDEERLSVLVKQLEDRPTPRPEFADELWAKVQAELDVGILGRRRRRGPRRGVAAAIAVAAALALMAAVLLPSSEDSDGGQVTTRPSIADPVGEDGGDDAGGVDQRPAPEGDAGSESIVGGRNADGGGSTKSSTRGPSTEARPSATGPVEQVTGRNPGPAAVAGIDTVVFASDRDGTRGIWTMSLDGNGLRRIAANGLAAQEFPDWSPDGRHVVFTEGRSLVVVGFDGGGRREIRLPGGGRPIFPAFSPDGTMIAFQLEPETVCDDRVRCPGDVWVVRTDGTGARRLTDGHQPRWFPDGQRLVYVEIERPCSSTPFDEIYWPSVCYGPIEAVGLDGGEPERLSVSDAGSPSVSPDGKTLVAETYSQGSGTDISIVVIGSGRAWRAVASTTGDEYTPTWTPDGRIVYSRSAGRGSVLAIMNGDGSSKANLPQQEFPSNSANVLPRVVRRAT